MQTPEVSVIMPVYNSAAYLEQAIDSVLKQTFTDFELIIIDDGSVDNSEQIIKNYTDPRIRYIKQSQNLGVVAAMNTGLEAVSSPLVAIMHADDIAFADRLQNQTDYLKNHSQIDVLAGFIISINEMGELVEEWKEDRLYVTAADIRNEMISSNCIAHSTVMMRTKVIKRYGYTSSPKHKGYAVEDYLLWLHLLSDNYIIEKMPIPVLYYRVHVDSATGTFLRKRNPFLVKYFSKQFFLQQRKQAGKWNSFDRKVVLSMYCDYAMGMLKQIKKTISF